MKKKIIYSSAFLTAILSATTVLAGGPEIIPVQPDYFTGFFVGGTGSVHEATFDADQSTNIDPYTFTSGVVGIGVASTRFRLSSGPVSVGNSVDGGSWDGYGGVQGGLGITVAHQYYLGVAGFGEWGNQNHSSSNFSNVPVTVATTSVSGLIAGSIVENTTLSSTTKVQMNNDYGIFFKPGLLLTPTVMVYGKLGAVWANEKISNTASYDASLMATAAGIFDIPLGSVMTDGTISGSSSTQRTKTAFLLGGGVESFVFPAWFGNHVTVSADYSWANFGHVTTTTPIDGVVNVSTNPVSSTTPSSFVVTGQTSATAASTLSIFQGAVNVYFGNTIL